MNEPATPNVQGELARFHRPKKLTTMYELGLDAQSQRTAHYEAVS